MHALADHYALGLDLADDGDAFDTIVDDGGPGLARCLALASIAALAQRLARVESELRDTSKRNRGKPWHRVRVSLRDRLAQQIRDAQERL